jgi:hypothetical protein
MLHHPPYAYWMKPPPFGYVRHGVELVGYRVLLLLVLRDRMAFKHGLAYACGQHFAHRATGRQNSKLDDLRGIGKDNHVIADRRVEGFGFVANGTTEISGPCLKSSSAFRSSRTARQQRRRQNRRRARESRLRALARPLITRQRVTGAAPRRRISSMTC